MPLRKTSFYSGGVYHVYNRGVEQRKIFLDDEDYESFVGILRYYLLGFGQKGGLFREKLSLLCYCLMPNHFHFMIKQYDESSLSEFMRRIGTTYAMSFNRKYRRVGSLFQGRFKAKAIVKDEYCIHLSKYIHNNPVEVGLVSTYKDWRWSSIGQYIGIDEHGFCDTRVILDYFADSRNSYKHYLDEQIDEKNFKKIDVLNID